MKHQSPTLMALTMGNEDLICDDKVHNFSSHPELVFNERVYYDNLGHLISEKCKFLLDSAYYEQHHHSIKNPYFRLK